MYITRVCLERFRESFSGIYFILLSGLSSLVVLTTLFSLNDQIKEEKNTLTDKEIYLLQKLAKKK